jgi:hypothetical protein
MKRMNQPHRKAARKLVAIKNELLNIDKQRCQYHPVGTKFSKEEIRRRRASLVEELHQLEARQGQEWEGTQ